ncbi:MAG: histidine kinase [Methylacidiphilales bacterium]|nr:histidine kinase [Candidatus Methylacidiphilales bacterium]
MPTLIRFLTILALIGGAIYGGLFALATMVEPEPRDMSVTVSPDRFHRAN